MPYGRPNNKPLDPSVYSVDYFSKRREYPGGGPLASNALPSASFDRHAAPARLPTREMPLSASPGADYMSHRSYRDHVPTDSYSSRGTQQLGLSRTGNSSVQQLGVTRAGNSNAYDYTEVHFNALASLFCKWPSPNIFFHWELETSVCKIVALSLFSSVTDWDS
jgi:poly(rC)-binding protein 2/3/4